MMYLAYYDSQENEAINALLHFTFTTITTEKKTKKTRIMNKKNDTRVM